MSEDAFAAAARIAELTGVPRHDVALVLGSGWLAAADSLGTTRWEGSVEELPDFAPPAVEGHAGRVHSVEAGGNNALVFLGRTHLYEASGPDTVATPVRAPSRPAARRSC